MSTPFRSGYGGVSVPAPAPVTAPVRVGDTLSAHRFAAPAWLLCSALLWPLACSTSSGPDREEGAEEGDESGGGDGGGEGSGLDSGGVDAPATDAQLQTFYGLHGGREALPAHQVLALEALLHAEDALEAGDRAEARARVDAAFDVLPLSEAIWREDAGVDGTNIGDPVAYYGLRMIDQILRIDAPQRVGQLRMTAVVAPCARVSRPTLPDLVPETVDLEIDPLILANDARTLHTSTRLFRWWVEAVTGGVEVELLVHVLDGCTTVSYTDDGATIVSYPDATGMVSAVPEDIAAVTDLWWVVAPSGVPGDGAGYGRHFITGGMGGFGSQPLFLSDDAWFTRKVEHLGAGPYTEVELRAYQPQWFQHEFMHHIFRTWPEFGLEETGHQWFDRSTWPEDFEGQYEPDYYIEAIDKRLLAASPSLAEGLKAPDWGDVDTLEPASLAGDYRREPVENEWHQVTITVEGDGFRWSNAAGVSWGLEVRDGKLWTAADCPYGESEVPVQLENGAVAALWFGGERYGRAG